jgi:hypothetical protein
LYKKLPKIKKILILGINNLFAIKLLETLYKNYEVYGYDIVYLSKYRRKYKKIFFPKNGNILDSLKKVLEIKFDLIYYFDYFPQETFLLSEDKAFELYKNLRFYFNKAKPKKIIFISNTYPLNLFLKKDNNYSYTEKKYKWSFQLENLIKRANFQNWKIFRFHNIIDAYYYNHYLHQMLYSLKQINTNNQKTGTFYIIKETEKSFITLDKALELLKQYEVPKSTGVYIFSSKEKINTKILFQFLLLNFKKKPKYIIYKKNLDFITQIEPDYLKNVNFIATDIDIINEIFKILKIIRGAKRQDTYLVKMIYKN